MSAIAALRKAIYKDYAQHGVMVEWVTVSGDVYLDLIRELDESANHLYTDRRFEEAENVTLFGIPVGISEE